MPKLHEILAVEGDLDGKQGVIVGETVTNFTKKPEHYREISTSKRMLAEKDKPQDTDEHKPMLTTVRARLDWTAKAVARYWDALARKAYTNAVARANVEIDGKVLMKDVPATLLLTLEGKLKALREVYVSIPTLDPNRTWEPDRAAGENIFVSPQVKRTVTAKAIMHKVLYEATEHHPAQIEKWTEDVPVGHVLETQRSGMLTSADKSDLIERVDTLLRAVKRARMRSNEATVIGPKIGSALFDYIHKGEINEIA